MDNFSFCKSPKDCFVLFWFGFSKSFQFLCSYVYTCGLFMFLCLSSYKNINYSILSWILQNFIKKFSYEILWSSILNIYILTIIINIRVF